MLVKEAPGRHAPVEDFSGLPIRQTVLLLASVSYLKSCLVAMETSKAAGCGSVPAE